MKCWGKPAGTKHGEDLLLTEPSGSSREQAKVVRRDNARRKEAGKETAGSPDWAWEARARQRGAEVWGMA